MFAYKVIISQCCNGYISRQNYRMMDSLEGFSSDLIASHADLLTIIGNTLLRVRLITNQCEAKMLNMPQSEGL